MLNVIIERRIMPGLEEEYENAARSAMHASLGASGFIGGETLMALERADQRLMVTRWRDERAWKAWYTSEARATAMQRILPLLCEEETVRLYQSAR